MPTVPSTAALVGFYDYRLVVLSVLISTLASYAALDLGGRVTAARGLVQHFWAACGSVTMGLGIWAMHYIGMLAWDLPVAVLYHWPTVLLSLLAAILASGVALFVVSRDELTSSRTGIGGVLMGIGIAGMHYIGMEAMRLRAMCHYSAGMVALSVILAIAISMVALRLTFQLRDENAATGWRKLGSAILMGAAIPVMHYTGMAAVTFMPMDTAGSLANTVAISWLGTLVISSVTVVILGLAILTSLIDRRFAAQARELQNLTEILERQNEQLEAIVVARTRELAEAHARLTLLDRAKDDFLTIISHELRTPLNGLLGVSEIVLGETSPSEESRELRSMYEQSRQRIMSILDDALLLTKINLHSEKFKSTPSSLNVVLDRAMERAMPFAGSRQVALQRSPEHLGQVHGEKDLLVRAFHALIETAVKFSDEGGAVRIAGDVVPNSLRVSIESLGRTIPGPAIAKFFDTFSIGEAISPGGDLGLSAPVASRILSLFGGAVTVANREPSGIRLTVEFDAVTQDVAVHPAA
ncbi:MAG: hypothetical protein LAP39_13425 [Acidobacteriia bacterium]|nr:hypothetical protein [Terriglobia bacterium]